MPNNRDIQQDDLKAIRDDWWIPIRLTAPGGVVYSTAKDTTDPLLGDVRKEGKELDPDIGGVILVKKTSVTIRLQDLVLVPQEGENWLIEFSDTLLDSGSFVKYAFTPNNVASLGDSMGFIKVYPQEVAA